MIHRDLLACDSLYQPTHKPHQIAALLAPRELVVATGCDGDDIIDDDDDGLHVLSTFSTPGTVRGAL